VTNGTINLRNGVYYSPGGHPVVADSGYEGDAGFYATGPVYFDITDVEIFNSIEAVDGFTEVRNILNSLQMAYAVLAFDPDTVWRVGLAA
jgi:hypothetical protein